MILLGITDEEQERLKGLVNRNKSEIPDGELTDLTRLALQRKFAYPEWALYFEVTGKHGKRADAIAYNLFPSRNWKTVGMEVKVSRSDWKKELETASKNDWFVGQVDEFYVVAGRKGIVRESELPEGWGLYEMKGGGKLYQVKESQLTDHQKREMDEEFYMRAVKKAVEKQHEAEKSLSWAKKSAYREGKKAGRKEGDLSREQRTLIRQGEKFKKLEENLEISLYSVADETIERINKAIEVVDKLDKGNYRSLASSLSSLKKRYARMEDEIDELEEVLQDLDEEIAPKVEKGLERFQKKPGGD